MAEYKAWCELHPSRPASPPASRKISNIQPADDEDTDGPKRNSSGSVKFLAQKFVEASRVARNEEQDRQAPKNGSIPKVYAYVHPIRQPLSPLFDPFLSAPNACLDKTSSQGKESLIPKPIREVGRGRSAEVSYSPISTSTSPKRTAPSTPKERPDKCLPTSKVVPDKDAEIVRSNVRGGDNVYTDAHKAVITGDLLRDISPEPGYRLETTRLGSSYQSNSQDSNASPSRPFSYESMRRVQPGRERPETWHSSSGQHIGRPLSTSQLDEPAPEMGYLTPSSPSRVNTYRSASEALKKLERHGSINATMYQQIIWLQRMLEHRGEEVQAARRSLDAVKEARDARDAKPNKFSPRNSWSKGTMAADVKEANRELAIWKRRAEEAEKRLADIEGPAEKAMGNRGLNVDVQLETGEERPAEKQGVDVVVLVVKEEQKGEGVAKVYEDEGWGGDDLTSSSAEVPLSREVEEEG